jgi:hypothetical protein
VSALTARLAATPCVAAVLRTKEPVSRDLWASQRSVALYAVAAGFPAASIPHLHSASAEHGSLFRMCFDVRTPRFANLLSRLLRAWNASRCAARSVPSLVVVLHVARTAHRDAVVRIEPQVRAPSLGNQVARIKRCLRPALLTLSSCTGNHRKPPCPEQFEVTGIGLNRDDV